MEVFWRRSFGGVLLAEVFWWGSFGGDLLVELFGGDLSVEVSWWRSGAVCTVRLLLRAGRARGGAGS